MSEQVSKRGGTPEILRIMMLYWFEPVLYLDPVFGCLIGFKDDVGDALTFKISKNDLNTE
jgi:hypothetical protein